MHSLDSRPFSAASAGEAAAQAITALATLLRVTVAGATGSAPVAPAAPDTLETLVQLCTPQEPPQSTAAHGAAAPHSQVQACWSMRVTRDEAWLQLVTSRCASAYT